MVGWFGNNTKRKLGGLISDNSIAFAPAWSDLRKPQNPSLQCRSSARYLKPEGREQEAEHSRITFSCWDVGIRGNTFAVHELLPVKYLNCINTGFLCVTEWEAYGSNILRFAWVSCFGNLVVFTAAMMRILQVLRTILTSKVALVAKRCSKYPRKWMNELIDIQNFKTRVNFTKYFLYHHYSRLLHYISLLFI
jgi:hypothetical protein